LRGFSVSRHPCREAFHFRGARLFIPRRLLRAAGRPFYTLGYRQLLPGLERQRAERFAGLLDQAM